MFPPDTLSTEYEIHQDFTVFYRANGTMKAKTFFVESYGTSANVVLSTEGDTITIEAIEVENGPPGMRSRLSMRSV